MTHTLVRRALAPVVALTLVGTLAACSGTTDADGSGGAPATEQPADGTATFNDADVLFAQMMIPHHEQAIEMSDVLLAKDGIDPEVVALAEQIKQAQGPEIETLTAWLGEWGADVSGGGHDAMHGMMSGSDMEALDAADGAEAQTLFLEQMIVHHEGAVDMARVELEDGQHTEAVEMAQVIVDAQSDEVGSMEDLLAAQ